MVMIHASDARCNFLGNWQEIELNDPSVAGAVQSVSAFDNLFDVLLQMNCCCELDGERL